MFNTFLSCDTRTNHVCLNRQESVPMIGSAATKDPVMIQKSVGCNAASVLPPTPKGAPVPAGPLPRSSAAPVPRKESFYAEDDDGDYDAQEEGFYTPAQTVYLE